MLHSEFIDHLARKGVVRDEAVVQDRQGSLRSDAIADVDWVGLTKLTQSALADELAAFCKCARMQRRDLIGGRFAGGRLARRFLKDATTFSV